MLISRNVATGRSVKRLNILLGLFGATPPQHWSRLSWHLLTWFSYRLFGLELGPEQVLVFRRFKAVVNSKGRGGLVFLHEIVTKGIYDIDVVRADTNIRIVFDAGANCGFFALRYASASPSSHIFCFEPHPD